MSKFLKPCLYSGKGVEGQWINNICGSHDLFCGCCNPFDHLKDILKRQTWHPTRDIGTTTDNGDDPDFPTIDEGDLAKLFEAADEENER